MSLAFTVYCHIVTTQVQSSKVHGSKLESEECGVYPVFATCLPTGRYAKRSCTEVQSELYVALDKENGSPCTVLCFVNPEP